jgi:hypothetical protein
MRNDQDTTDRVAVKLPDDLFYQFIESIDHDRRMIERYAKDNAE